MFLFTRILYSPPIHHQSVTPSNHPPGSSIPRMACPKRPQQPWYVGAIAHRNPTARLNQAVTGSPTRSGSTPDFELFPPAIGLPVPNRHGQSPKSSKSAAPASAFARRVGALRVLKDNGFHDFAPRSTTSLTGGGFLADDFGFAGITSGSLWEKKLPARPRPHRAGRQRNFGRLKFDHSRRRSPLCLPNSAFPAGMLLPSPLA